MKTHLERSICRISRSSHLIAIHLEHYTHPPRSQAERVAVHRSLEWSAPRGADPSAAETPYLPCHFWPLLLKDKHDVSRATGPEILSSFPHAGHVHRHQRPVDPVLLRAAGGEHKCRGDEGPHGSHRRGHYSSPRWSARSPL